VIELVDGAGGSTFVFRGEASDETQGLLLENLFVDVRETEWKALLRECDSFEHRLSKEWANKQFGLAELEQAEEAMKRLRRRFREIKRRDVFHAPLAGAVEMRLRECRDLLDESGQHV
jgi:hypothetical protein